MRMYSSCSFLLLMNIFSLYSSSSTVYLFLLELSSCNFSPRTQREFFPRTIFHAVSPRSEKKAGKFSGEEVVSESSVEAKW